MGGVLAKADPAREAAFRALLATHNGAYLNVELPNQLRQLSHQDAAFATELAHGTARLQGSYDQIIVRAAGRELKTMQPAVIVVLRMVAHQLLSMRVPAHAAISSGVDLASRVAGERTKGIVNAISRKIAARDLDGWLAQLPGEPLAVQTHHPQWIVDAYAQALPQAELEPALAANNVPAQVCLAAYPGLCELTELAGEPTAYSPYGVRAAKPPGEYPPVAEHRAGVQDEGSQLVCLALARAAQPGRWLDLCAGPGGKTALLRGLGIDTALYATELHGHRAQLVKQNLSGYVAVGRQSAVLVADGVKPPFQPGIFQAVLADVPCTGLGALRRRPDARWRKADADLPELVALQKALLRSAIELTAPGGVVAYVTCSPHPAETSEVLHSVLEPSVKLLDAPSFLPEVRDAASRADSRFIQLWPHRHQTDAMFCALIGRIAQ